MKLKIFVLTFLILGRFWIKAQAVGVADIDSILVGAATLLEDTQALYNFANRLRQAKDRGFTVSIEGSTNTINLSNANKQSLIGEYMGYLNKIQIDKDAMPQ